MRKLRDFDMELRVLADKVSQLKERRVRQLGLLVAATGADALDADMLAGVLLDAASMNDSTVKEGWRERGARFFHGKVRRPAQRPQPHTGAGAPHGRGAASACGGEGAHRHE